MSIEQFADMIRQSNRIVFFGGAGVSTESGMKDYRSKDGLYHTVKDYGVPPETILSIDFFKAHPDIFYDFYRKYFMVDAQPNKAHEALVKLEQKGKLKSVITQNIDGLHQKAGSKNVIELHGTAKRFYCYACNKMLDAAQVLQQIKKGEVPKCSFCGGLAKPKVVLYGEMLYDGVAEAAIDNIENADMLIIGGTSLAVYPAASFVQYFKGKYIVVVNRDATNFDNHAGLVFRDSIGAVFNDVMRRLE